MTGTEYSAPYLILIPVESTRHADWNVMFSVLFCVIKSDGNVYLVR